MLGLTAVLIYGGASIFDSISAVLDWQIEGGAPMYVSIWADAGFTLAGSLESLHNWRRRSIEGHVPFIGSLFFAFGGLAYLISGILCELNYILLLPEDDVCWVGDIVGALLFCVNALIIFLPLFIPICVLMFERLRKNDEETPLFLQRGESSTESQEEEPMSAPSVAIIQDFD